MRPSGTGEELLWRVGTKRKKRRQLAACLFVVTGALGAKLAWDARSKSMPVDLARLVAQQNDTKKQIAAVVTLLRESSDNNEALLKLSRNDDPKVAEQAAIALDHLRRQLSR